MDSIFNLVLQHLPTAAHRVAIEQGNCRLTYHELVEAAECAARQLRQEGVGKGALVGIFLERSPELVVQLLACLRVGAIFIPLDPAYPDGRLELMLSVVEPGWLIARLDACERLQQMAHRLGLERAQVLLVGERVPAAKESDGVVTAECAATAAEYRDVDPVAAPEDPCYIFFTSGSTGKPKGILGCRKGLLHFIQWEIETFGIGPMDRVSHFTTPSFDAMLRDLFVPLAAGGTVCIPEEQEVILEPARLVQWIEEKELTLVHCVPSLFKRILSEVQNSKHFPTLRYILMAGERVSPGDVSRWYSLMGERIKLVNLYGASETTMVKLYHIITPADGMRSSIPVGKPMQGAKVILLDQDRNICPPGVVGEIYIRTPYMTLGYYKDPEKTREVFLQNPFNNKPGDLIYKTGDLGRFLPDGSVEFIGRFDQQVKIRGVRVELGDIETAIASHPDVKEVAVVVQSDADGENYPVAYLVQQPAEEAEEATGAADLRQYLQQRLPEYMLPAQFVFLKAMPLSPNGKIDRKALPVAEVQSTGQREYVAPRTELEMALVKIYEEVLQRTRIGLYDNFFTIGGHSLNATRVISRIYHQMNVQVPLRQFFRHATVAELAQVISELQQMGTTGHKGYQSIAAGAKAAYYLLSHGQRRLWIQCQMGKEQSSAYNLSFAFELVGPLQVTAFAQAFQELTRRHETLRTYFTVVDGEPVQVVDDGYEFALEVHDLAITTTIQPWISAEAARPFDLAKPGLFRASLTELETEKYLFVFTMHHIIADAWSFNVLIKELCTLYNAELAGRSVTLPPLRIQYRDYAVWQREQAGGVLREQQAYWHQHLAGEIPVLDWPTDLPRPAVHSYAGARMPFVIPSAIQQRLHTLATEQGTTLFALLFAVYNLLLNRYSRQEACVVGIPVHGRTDPELEGLIGFFINTLAVKTEIAPRESFLQFLARVQQTLLRAFENQDYPFDRLVEDLQIQRDPARSPLFDTMFVLQNTPELADTSLTMGELQLRPLKQERDTSRFDLTLTLMETPEGLAGTAEYSTALFHRATVERMMEHYTQLLESVLATPEAPLTGLKMISTAEKAELLRYATGEEIEYRGVECLHQLIERWSRERSEELAIIYPGGQLTYSELDAAADRLARELVRLGLAVETPVALLFERSAALIISMLAVLKAGGAYLPVAPDYPAERIAYILRDARAPVALTTSQWLSRLPEEYQHREIQDRIHQHSIVLAVHEGQGSWFQEAAGQARNTDEMFPEVRPENLAYIIYTSGSTGRPKGVMVEHRSIVNTVQWKIRNYGYRRGERILQLLAVAFDGAQDEILVTLAAGLTLVLPDLPTGFDAEVLSRQIRHHGVNHIVIIPALYQNLLATLHGEPLQSLKTITVAGEQATEALWQQHNTLHGGVQLYNGYGPTETTIVCTSYTTQAGATYPGGIPIGFPVDNMRVYILNEEQQLQALGLPGEIYISGIGVARGYVNHPDLTAERFLPDPFHPGARMYKSGDLARYLPDGVIQFLGRRDDQVKIRGYRIETGEVETAFRRLTRVHDVAVLPLLTPQGEQYLAAYVVAGESQKRGALQDGVAADSRMHGAQHDEMAVESQMQSTQQDELAAEPLTPAALHQELARVLPEPMIPGVIIFLDALPLNANGKIDRKALPRPSSTVEQESAPPENALETAIARIWSEVLGVERVGRDDHFFALGGHSLRATQVMTRISRELGLDCSLELFFAAPTVAGLARALATQQRVQQEIIQAGQCHEMEPVSHAQKRLWVIDQFAESRGAYNIHLTLPLYGALDVQIFRQALQTIVERHETLRTRFALHEGEPVQIIEKEITLPLQIVDLSSELAGTSSNLRENVFLRQFILAEALKPFDLTEPGLFRCLLAKVAEEEYLFLCTMHHIISDGWSIEILRKEIITLYSAYTQKQPDPVPPLPIQYRDYANWQNSALKAGELQSQQEYWLKEMSGEIPVLQLPADSPRPRVQTFRGADLSFTFDRTISRDLEEFARSRGLTMFMLLMSAYNILLYHYTGQTDLIVGTPVAGRSNPELEPIIGFFVNTLPVRTQFAPTEHFDEFLQHARTKILAHLAHQDYPFDALVDELELARDVSRSPLFDTMFVFQNIRDDTASPDEADDFADAEPGRTQWQVHEAVSKFDLTLSFSVRNGRYVGKFNFNTNLFRVETMARMAVHFRQLVQEALAEPGQSIAGINILTAEERALLLDRFSGVVQEHPSNLCIHQIFEEQAQRSPDQVAVICREEQLTYRQLNERANQLARHLVSRGIEADTLVGILIGRSPAVLISILAVLKAGGAYLPIDPGYPAARIAEMLSDSAVELLLTEMKYADAIPAEFAGEIIALDGLLAPLGSYVQQSNTTTITTDRNENESGIQWSMQHSHSDRMVNRIAPELAKYATENLNRPVKPANLAYVIYTSGSTGKPKGVMVEHRNLLNEYYAGQQIFHLTAERPVLLQVVSHSFDVFLGDQCHSIYCGGTMVLATEEERYSLEALAGLIEKHGVTMVTATTGFSKLLLEYIHEHVGPVPSLRWFLLGGEVLRVEDYKRLQALAGENIQLMNCYGITETTIDSTAFIGPVPAGIVGGVTPVGKPLPNVRVYILNPAQNPVPVGVTGEIYIGGAGVARGYLGRPELTAELFLPDPFLENAEARMYRSGDLGRWLPDGNIEFCGRRDQQVKIRGYRIETAEIERVLLTHPFIQDAAVVDLQTAHGELYLAAYIVGRTEAPGEEEVLRYLSTRLPDYMLPQACVQLDALPRTPNGKLDRRALPTPALHTAGFEAPQTETEVVIAELWSEILGVEEPGVHEHFFHLGGNSLKLIQLMMRVNRQFAVNLTLKDFLENPTITAEAALLQKQGAGTGHPCLIKLRAGETAANLFCVHPGGGGTMMYVELAQHLHPALTIYGLQARGLFSNDTLPQTLEAMASDYIAAIKTAQPVGPYQLIGHSLGGRIAFEMAHQLEAGGDEVSVLMLLDTHEFSEYRHLPPVEEQVKAMLLTDLEQLGIRPTRGAKKSSLEELIATYFTTANLENTPYYNLTSTEIVRLYQVRKQILGVMTVPTTALNADLTIIKAKESRHRKNPGKTWPVWTNGKAMVLEVPGDHYTMLSGSNARKLAEVMSSILGNC